MNNRVESETVLPRAKAGKLLRGTAVTISFGPFRELGAVVVSMSRKRVVVSCSLQGRSSLLELDDTMVQIDHASENEDRIPGSVMPPSIRGSLSELLP
jgi:hypothetical protein